MLPELFIHPSNCIFSISLILCLLIGLLELILLCLGGSAQALDQWLPDQLMEHPSHSQISVDSDSSIIWQFLDWLYLGRIPLLIWFVIFLTIYSLLGLSIQYIVYITTEDYFSAWWIAPTVFFLCMPIVRWSSAAISSILPKDETTAISNEDLIGQHAEIILGDAKPNSPAQAKVKDHFKQIHYVLVEPEQDGIFKQGQTVILTRKTNIGFQAISLHKKLEGG